MTDHRRLTTDRFYGGTSRRIELLHRFLRLTEGDPISRSKVKDWIISNTPAQSRDAIDHHFGFLEAIELIDLTDDMVSLGDRGRQYLATSEPSVLFEALHSNVQGFETILRSLQDNPMTDEEIKDLLVTEVDDFGMNSTGVATRHREWLQVLGYVDRSDGVNRLTESGRKLAGEFSTGDHNIADKERVSELRGHLLKTDMACVPDGRQTVTDGIYPSVKATYPELCNNDFLCSEAHDTSRHHPEWKHVVQEALQQLGDKDDSRVRRDSERGVWVFLPQQGDGPPESAEDTPIDAASAEGEYLPEGNQTTERRESTREDVVRDESLVRELKALYDDTCQICGDRRRKSPSEGFSHVHHLMPLGDPHNGPDVPENVLVVCPNHHEDFENGVLTIDPHTLEIDHLYEESISGKSISTKEGHDIGPQYIAYQNQVRAESW